LCTVAKPHFMKESAISLQIKFFYTQKKINNKCMYCTFNYKKKFSPTLRNIYKKTAWCTTLCGENAVNFLCTSKWRVRDCTPKNLDVPPKMKVKGYMYPIHGLCVCPTIFFCNVIYNLSNFVFYTELNARLPIYSHDH
jgi:hypothetical protein